MIFTRRSNPQHTRWVCSHFLPAWRCNSAVMNRHDLAEGTYSAIFLMFLGCAKHPDAA